jgi:hypothetical protein
MNTWAPGDGDGCDFWPEIAQKGENFSPGICQHLIYGNIPVIAEE